MRTVLSAMIGLIGLSLIAFDADAARLGGGRSLGMQRSAPAPQRAAPTPSPQQQQPQATPATPAPQPQPSGLQKWLGPLAGLALGAGLAALFFHNGVTGLLAGLLVIGLIVAAITFIARMLMRGSAGERPLQYAGVSGAEPSPPAYPGGAGANSVAATTAAGLPAGFDAVEFARHAKLNFVRLQEAHDKKDLSMMRDFLAPGVYREIEMDILAAGDAPRSTDVVTLDAEVLDVAEEAGSYIVSVRFSGQIREEAGSAPEPFSEIWHLEKPLTGRSGWLVAGIQQS